MNIKQLVATYKWENNGGGGQITVAGLESNLESQLTKKLDKQKKKHPQWGNYIITSKNIYDIDYKSSNGDSAKDSTTGENTGNIKTTTPINVSTNNISSNSGIIESVALVDEIRSDFKNHVGWDPRLYRVDEFLLTDKSGKGIRAPFASYTAATAFADMTSRLEAGVIKAMNEKKDFSTNSQIDILTGNTDKLKELKNSRPQPPQITNYYKYLTDQNSWISAQAKYEKDLAKWQQDYNKAQAEEYKLLEKTKRDKALGYVDAITNFEKNSELMITDDTTVLESDNQNWGVQSIMNPFSLTKLVGGLVVHGKTAENYMYDIRDQRRFYAMQNSTSDFTSISNPTVTELIKWSNADQWGRTPYSFQDFVYCKHFGLIPNNRLITFRRYTVPTYDNLQFENMYGETKNNTVQSKDNIDNKTFSPLTTVVTWFGGDTGNSLNALMSFSTGTNWEDLKAEIWNVDGDTGESQQAVIDKFLGDGDHTGLFQSAEVGDLLNGAQETFSKLTGKLTSLGKFYLAATGNIGESEDAFKKRVGLNQDPWDSTYRNRIQGPINRIDAVKRRTAGIKFSQTLNIKCSYKAKAIGGINPKAALLDVLGNCLEMCSPHAVFWGGGHRFMIEPRIYPFHDGGWRDSFMAKVYEGKFLGNDGAIATVLSGFKKVGEGGGGEFNFDTAKDMLGKIGGSALGLLGGAIASISDMFGGVDFLDKAADKMFGTGSDLSNEDKEKVTKEGKERAGNIITNLKQMWHNRMMSETALPSIKSGGNILVGEPTGEWHLTIGNPLNPMMVIGNLICSEMKVSWDEEIGPDDFPTGFSVEYTIEHGMARDSDGIQSMFNRGMGKFYALPDYITTSSEQTTYVDNYTKDVGGGVTGRVDYKNPTPLWQAEFGTGVEDKSHYQTFVITPGSKPKNSGNFNTTLITKFTPMNYQALRTIESRQSGTGQFGNPVISHIRSLAATRKLTNN